MSKRIDDARGVASERVASRSSLLAALRTARLIAAGGSLGTHEEPLHA